MRKSEPWYIHAPLWVVIVILTYLLIQVAIIQPSEIMKKERYYKGESRARMVNIRQAEILWQKKNGSFTDKLDSLLNYVATDSSILKLMTEIDTITHRSKNPFTPLTNGEFSVDSLFRTPKSNSFYILKVDTSQSIDTVINRYGKLVSIDTNIVIGTRYLLECPDGYGKIGDLYSDALKNTASWE
jgi:hypothetical protein